MLGEEGQKSQVECVNYRMCTILTSKFEVVHCLSFPYKDTVLCPNYVKKKLPDLESNAGKNY